jgi:hypothetical protein
MLRRKSRAFLRRGVMKTHSLTLAAALALAACADDPASTNAPMTAAEEQLYTQWFKECGLITPDSMGPRTARLTERARTSQAAHDDAMACAKAKKAAWYAAGGGLLSGGAGGGYSGGYAGGSSAGVGLTGLANGLALGSQGAHVYVDGNSLTGLANAMTLHGSGADMDVLVDGNSLSGLANGMTMRGAGADVDVLFGD